MSSAPFVIFLNDEATYQLHVEPTAEALAELAAKGVVFWGQKAISRRGVFHLALSGGSTPRALYQRLAEAPYAAQLDWPNVHVWWSDERDVPADHPESNYKLAYEAMLSRLPLSPQQIHRAPTELGPSRAADHYEAEIRDYVGEGRFDLILLGLGEDGHTASLFPGTQALKATDRLVVANFVPKLNAWRITFTAPLINAADTVFFLVSGAAKATALHSVLLGGYQPEALPAQLIAPVPGKLFWMADADAAAQVASKPQYPESDFIYWRIPQSRTA
jgi:6-phosphogluconolactonase